MGNTIVPLNEGSSRADASLADEGQAAPSTPAKASRFVDPKTGRFDYWGWIDAGMANVGKGGTLFEDDTPYPEHPYEPNQPSAFLAAGAPENAQMPDESRFETGKGTGQGEFLQPVAMKAGEESTPAKDTAPSAPAQETAPPVPSVQGQPQPDPLPEEYTGLPITEDGWRATPWGQESKFSDRLPSTAKDGPQVDPHAYEYPKVGEPPDTEEGRQIRSLIEKYAKEYGVPVQLLFNKAHVETGGTWNTKANSGKAYGLFQFTPATGKYYGIEDKDNIEQNVRAAARYMSSLLQKSNGDPFIAEIGYNANPKHMWSGNPLPVETFYHLQKVFPDNDIHI